MKSLNKNIHEYGKQVKQGDLKLAYQGLMDFVRRLRIHFKDEHQEYNVSGRLYQGNMDISFFSLTTKALKAKELKVAVVYVHENSWFELWLTGRNSGVKNKYRRALQDKGLTSILFP